jgi:uncharacterized protein YfaP (DUF2135 family)
MKNNTFPSPAFVVKICLAAFAFTMVSAEEPRPDNKSLIFPSLSLKAGHPPIPPGGATSGLIRSAYANIFEPYWKETSYFEYDPATGLKEQGFYVSTKTFGYTYVPWPLSSRENRPTAFLGSTQPLFRQNMVTIFEAMAQPFTDDGNILPFGGNNPILDGFWTPGEAFMDVNGDGEWTEGLGAEPFWDTNNNSFFRVNSCGDLIRPRLEGPVGEPGDPTLEIWSDLRGEFYADYDGSTIVNSAGRVISVGFNPAATIWVADEANNTNNLVVINEMNIKPSCPDLEGDLIHTWIDSDGNASNPANDIPQNGRFDYTVDTTVTPWVFRAIDISDGQPAFTTYKRFEYEATGDPYTAAGPFPNGPDDPTVVLRTVEVPIYQSSELFNQELFVSSAEGIFGDPFIPNPPPVQDGTWTPERPDEPWEDHLSWWDPTGNPPNGTGGFTYVVDGAGDPISDPRHPSRNTPITVSAYNDYVRWNYPGDAEALLALSFNDEYDGPQGYSYSNNSTSQHRQSSFVQAVPIPPTTPPPFYWDNRVFASWSDWWVAVFGSAPPPWISGIPNLDVYRAVVIPPVGGAHTWYPYSGSWGYNAAREFADLPSSIYYRGGDPSTGAVSWVGPQQLGIIGGDGGLGEATSPFSNSIFGQDIGGTPTSNTGAEDDLINSAGPFAYNVQGTTGFDAGNQLNIELLTRRNQPPAAVSGQTQAQMLVTNPHPTIFKDVNLDGMIDSGALDIVESNYATGRNDDDDDDVGYGSYPFNNQRYVEAIIAAWDYAEDFHGSFVWPPADPAGTRLPFYFYPIYPQVSGTGAASLAGPAGQGLSVMTRDSNTPISGALQVRPMQGGGIGGGGIVPASNFAMGILAHEQGHDLLGWPDLYDYDVWTFTTETINTPIGAYDLMSGAGLVQGIPDMKAQAGWVDVQDLQSILIPNGAPITMELFPITRDNDQYYKFVNPDKSWEYFYIWYADNNTDYGVPGAPGVFITHTDLGGNVNALPPQQRLNNRFIYEIINADGLNRLQDGFSLGDAGIPFPGSSDNRVFTAHSWPEARWWDQSDSGLRILDIQLPSGPQEPARVTFQWTPAGGAPRAGADSDGDGIPDAWELFYFGDLTTASADSDYRGDGITDPEAFLLFLDPTKNNIAIFARDADGDELTDIEELRVFGTDPFVWDTNDNGYSDGQHVSTLFEDTNYGFSFYMTNPLYSRSPQINRSYIMDGRNLSAPESERFDFLISEADAASITGVDVQINQPSDGSSSNERFITVSGQLTSASPLESAALFVEGALIEVLTLDVDGNFSTTIIINAGDNQIEIVGLNVDGGQDSETIVVTGNFSVADIRVTNTWSPAGDLDTWLVDPLGRHMGFTIGGPGLPDAPNGQIPGALLDIDDIPGTGPENITVEENQSVSGQYEVWVNNYSNSNNPASTVRVLVNEGRANEEFVEFGPRTLSTTDSNGSNSEAWWLVTTISMPSGTMSPSGRPVPGRITSGEESGLGGFGELVDYIPEGISGVAGVGGGFVSRPGFTIESWIKPMDADQTGLIAEYVLPDGRVMYEAGLRENKPFIRMANASYTQFYEASGLEIPVGEWTHLAFVYGETDQTVRLFVNGSSVSAQHMGLPRLRGNGQFDVDAEYDDGVITSSFDNAYLDELRIWSRARNIGLIARNMHQPVGTTLSLVAYYHFDDGGRGIEDSVQALDRSFDLGGFPLPDVETDAKPGADGIWGTILDIPSSGPITPDGQNDFVTAVEYAPVHGEIDTDEDGIPDWWEALYFDGPTMATAIEDLDGDGLNSLYEVLARTNPFDVDSNNNSIPDGLEDVNQDGVSNLFKQQYGLDPWLMDTDDNGIFDLVEIQQGSDSADSLSPLLSKRLYLSNGDTYVVAPRSPRFNTRNFAVEMIVKPSSLGADQNLIVREVEPGKYNYRLRILADGRVRLSFTSGDGTQTAIVTSPNPIVAGEDTHVFGAFDPQNLRLWLDVNGTTVASTQTHFLPATNGQAVPEVRVGGDGFIGAMNEVRIWSPFPVGRDPGDLYGPIHGDAPGLRAYLRFDDGTNYLGTSGNPDWSHGQVQDFAGFPQDWMTGWVNAWSIAGTPGGASILSVGGGGLLAQQAPADCVLSNPSVSLDALGAGWSTGAHTAGGSALSNPVKHWNCDPERAEDGSFSARAGGLTQDGSGAYTPILGNNEVSWLETQVIGPGTLTFAWSWGTEEFLPNQNPAESDNFNLLINGQTVETRNGWTNSEWGRNAANSWASDNFMPLGTDVTELGWQNITVVVPAGESTLRWEYRKDSFLAQYPDAVWLDNVSYVHTGPDSDGDGLPDAYETLIFGSDPNDPDTSGDGILDGDAVAYGMDPLTPATVVVSSAASCLNWVGTESLTYQVQRSTDMITWTSAPNHPSLGSRSSQTATSTGQAMSYCDPDPNPPSPVFYRVLLLP